MSKNRPDRINTCVYKLEFKYSSSGSVQRHMDVSFINAVCRTVIFQLNKIAWLFLHWIQTVDKSVVKRGCDSFNDLVFKLTFRFWCLRRGKKSNRKIFDLRCYLEVRAVVSGSACYQQEWGQASKNRLCLHTSCQLSTPDI